MSGEDQSPVPFEEQAALDELDRLRRELEETRQRRRQATDAFDSFLRSFGTRSSAPAAASKVPAAPDPQATQSQSREERNEPPPADVPTIGPSRVEDRPASARPRGFAELDDFPPEAVPAAVIPSPSDSQLPVGEPQVPMSTDSGRTNFEVIDYRDASSLTAKRSGEARHIPAALAPAFRDPRRRWAIIALGAVALTAAAILAWRGSSTARPDTPPAAETTGTAPARAAPPPSATTTAPAPIPVAEITTLRRVWVRVVVDGEPTIERELDPDVHIPLTPKQRFLVRAGDGGAVRVLIAGKDQGRLGPDGQPVTRAFVVAPAPPR